ncbi:MAG: hypothetical protein ACP6IY_04370, partial [Promethearchaeia archaeon]
MKKYNECNYTEEDIKKYERETGKKAIWRDQITKSFIKWLDGEKIYPREGIRWTIYLDKKDKDLFYKWKDFIAKIQEREPTYSQSQLGKDGINLFINLYNKLEKIDRNLEYREIKKVLENLQIPFFYLRIKIFEDFMQSITPLKLLSELIEKNIDNKEKLIQLVSKIRKNIRELDNKIKFYFENPEISRFIKQI